MVHRFGLKLRHPLSGWLVLVPSVVIIGLVLLLTPATSASPVPILPVRPAAQGQQPVCQNCHPKEYEAWKSTPHARAGGVTCEACHGAYKEGHPAKTTMQLPMASNTCETCHTGTFAEWKTSLHAGKNIQCFDCHNAHTQGLRTGSEEKLCAACHSERQTQVAHATHGISGVDCASCHMAPEKQAAGGSPAKSAAVIATTGAVRSHTFKVSGDVCAKCHESDVHTGNQVSTLRAVVNKMDPTGAQQQADRVPELQKQVVDLQDRVNSLRNAAALTMGLAFAVGGFAGLLFGIVGMTLWYRRNS